MKILSMTRNLDLYHKLPGPFPAPPPSQGKGPGNEVVYIPEQDDDHRRPIHMGGLPHPHLPGVWFAGFTYECSLL